MRYLKHILILSFILSSAGIVMAQFPGMRAVYANMNKQFINQQMQMQMMMNLNRNYGNLQFNNTYDFTVTLKDSTQKLVRSKIYRDTSLHKSYVIMENKALSKKDSLRKQKIYVSQTANITRSGTSFSNVPYTMVGIATDSCWLFKTTNGANINLYSFLSEPEFGDFDEATVVAIQQNDGPILKLSEENLKSMLTNDKDAMKYFIEKKYLKAIKTYNKNFAKRQKTKPPAVIN